MPTPSLFDFDENGLECYNAREIDALLRSQPATYINHLRMASKLSEWASDIPLKGKFEEGYAKALREVAAHLRQGDFAEGGVMLDGH